MSRRVLAFLAAACWVYGQSSITPQQIAQRLTANDLKADVSFLASDALEGRGTPSRGLEIAGEFIAAQFRRAGLEPAGDDGYFQNAAFFSVTQNPEGLEISLEVNGETVRADRSFVALQESKALDLKGAAAFKVVLDSPAALDALTPEQVRGKALIIEVPDSSGNGAGINRRLSLLAARVQPSILLLVRSGRPAGNPASRLHPADEIPQTPIVAVWDAGFRKSVSAAAPGPMQATLSAHLSAPTGATVKLRNVIGVLRGSDPQLKDTYVLVTAHYDHLGIRGTGEGDHIYNGADDDASGTASVIGIAASLAAQPVRPKRSIVFLALFGEELGLLGSRYYAQHPVFPLAKTIADLNLEQMGRTDDVTGPRVGIVNVTGYGYTTLTADLVKAGEDSGIKVVKDFSKSDSYYAASDNQALADAGVPAHTLSVGYVFPDYHRPGDEWPKLDYDNMSKVDCAVALAIFRVADNPEAPQWNADNPMTKRYIEARKK